MEWVLVLSLYTNQSGVYTKTFDSEQNCTDSMKSIISKIEKGDTSNVKSIICVPKNTFETVTEKQ